MQKEILAETSGYGLWYSTGTHFTKFYWTENESEAMTYLEGIQGNHSDTYTFYFTDVNGVAKTFSGSLTVH
jgi:hypothetical protein